MAAGGTGVGVAGGGVCVGAGRGVLTTGRGVFAGDEGSGFGEADGKTDDWGDGFADAVATDVGCCDGFGDGFGEELGVGLSNGRSVGSAVGMGVTRTAGASVANATPRCPPIAKREAKPPIANPTRATSNAIIQIDGPLLGVGGSPEERRIRGESFMNVVGYCALWVISSHA